MPRRSLLPTVLLNLTAIGGAGAHLEETVVYGRKAKMRQAQPTAIHSAGPV